MNDWGFELSNYMKQANAAMASGNYSVAYQAVVRAAECTLQLAKNSKGTAQEKYLANYKSLKSLLSQLEIKVKGVGYTPPPAQPVAPIVPPPRPSTPTNNGGLPFNTPPRPSTPTNNGGLPFNTPPRPSTPTNNGGLPFNTPPRPSTPTNNGGLPFNTPPRPSTPTNNGGSYGNTPPNASPVGGNSDGNTSPNTPPANANKGSKYGAKDSVSPRYLSDYIGQPDAVTAVSDLITAARIKNTAMPHIIIYGSNGLGKTTFAKIIANEMEADFIEVNVSKTTPLEMIAILKSLKPKDILFIDEIHTLPLIVAESLLYSAMQDGRITYTEGKGKFAKTVTMDLPPFTLIGATTEIGKLAKPFTHRAITIRLQEYTDEVLGGIVERAIHKIGMNITSELALLIAKRCRNNPRTANNIVKRITDKALVKHVRENNLLRSGPFDTPEAIRKLNIQIQPSVVEAFFTESGIDEHGLESGDRALLHMIIDRYKGGPVGLDNLARAMNESNNVIAQKYEAYLIKKGFIRVDRDGRVAMPEAYRVLGLAVPENKLAEEKTGEEEGDGKGNKGNKNANNTPPYNPPDLGGNDNDYGNNGYNGGNDYNNGGYNGNNGYNGNDGGSNEEKKSRYDGLKIQAASMPDPLKCEKIEELITYPPNARAVGENLDVLFPEVEKPEPEYKKTYALEVDFGTFKRSMICESKLESKFAMALAQTGYVTDLMAQTLEIPYISQELANRRYFPDFVLKDYKGRIAVVEMKNFDMVSYHLNIDKYEHLKRYCEANGFGYAEVMKPYDSERYISVEMLLNAPVNEELQRYIFDTIERNGEQGEPMFTEADFEDYCYRYGKVDRKEVYTILLNNRRLKNVDREGKNFMIKAN